MATKLFFHNAASDFGTGHNDARLNASTGGWVAKLLNTTQGASVTNVVTTSVAGPTSGLEIDVETMPYVWYSPPLNADATVSGSVTWNLRAAESSNSANASVNGRLEVIDGATGTITLIDQTARTTELSTSEAAVNFSETPGAGVAVKRGDRLRVRVYFDDAAANMGTGFNLTFWFDGATGATGDSWVQLTENLTFVSEPAGTTIYPTVTASAVSTASNDLEAWTSRGSTAQFPGIDSVTGWTAPTQLQYPVGGLVADWFTRPLAALTLGGAVRVNARFREGNLVGNATIRCEIARVAGDGTSPTVWGSTTFPAEPADTNENAVSFLVGGDDLAISAGQRLRIRFYADDSQAAAMATGAVLRLYVSGPTGGASGDTWLTFTQTLTEGGGPTTHEAAAAVTANATITTGGATVKRAAASTITGAATTAAPASVKQAVASTITGTATVTADASVVAPATGYAAVVLADSPNLYLRMGEASGSVLDSSGFGNNGTVSGSMTRDVAGAVASDDGAIKGDGSTSYVSIAHDADLNLGDNFTIELWYKPPVGLELNDYNYIYDKAGSGAAQVYIGTGDGSKMRLAFGGSGGDVVIANVSLTNTSHWYHCVFRKNGATSSAWVDGQDVTLDGGDKTSTITNNSGTLVIGAKRDLSAFTHVKGSIDELATYVGMLSDAQVLAHYAAGVGYAAVVMADSPISYWRLGESSGSGTAVDARGVNNGSYVSTHTSSTSALLSDPSNASTDFNQTGRVSIPHHASLNVGDVFTMEIWVRNAASGPGNSTFISKSSGGPSITVSRGNTRYEGYRSSTKDIQAPIGSLIFDQWQHVVWTKNGSDSRIYVDGVDVTIVNSPGAAGNSTEPLYIGSWSGSDELCDEIDEVAVYNYALSSTQVAAHYAAATGGVTYREAAASISAVATASATALIGGYASVVLADTPVGYWRLDEPSGTTMNAAAGPAGTYGASAGLGAAGLISNGSALDTGTGGIGYVTADGALDFGGNLTIETWARIDTMTDYATIFEKWSGDDTGGYALHLRSDGGVRFAIRGGGTNIELNTDPGDLTTGVEYHLVATFDTTANTANIYANGTLIRQHTGVTQNLTADTATGLYATIGGRDISKSGTVSLRFDGIVDEVAVYNAVLTPTKIAEHYLARTGAATTYHEAAASISAVATVASGATRVAGVASSVTATATVAPGAQRVAGVAATLSGAATITTAGAQRVAGVASTISGVATVTPGAQRVAGVASSVNGVATVAAPAQRVAGVATTINGVATVLPGASRSLAGAATISGLATVTTTVQRVTPAAATVSALATVTADATLVVGAVTHEAAATIAAAATVAGDAQRVAGVAAALTAAATVAPAPSATLAGASSIVATANISSTIVAYRAVASTITGLATVAPAAQRVSPLASTVSASATITTAGATAYRAGAAAVTGVATVAPTAIRQLVVASSVNGVATVAPGASAQFGAAAALTGTATTSAAVLARLGATASITGSVSVDANASIVGAPIFHNALASVTGSAVITGNLIATQAASAAVTANAVVSAAPGARKDAAATITATATIVPGATAYRIGSATITATATVAPGATRKLAAAAVPSATATVVAGALLREAAAAAVTALATVDANASLLNAPVFHNALAAVTATASVTTAASVLQAAAGSAAGQATVIAAAGRGQATAAAITSSASAQATASRYQLIAAQANAIATVSMAAQMELGAAAQAGATALAAGNLVGYLAARASIQATATAYVRIIGSLISDTATAVLTVHPGALATVTARSGTGTGVVVRAGPTGTLSTTTLSGDGVVVRQGPSAEVSR